MSFIAFKPFNSMFMFSAEVLEREVEAGITSEFENKTGNDCDCLPACTSLTYNAEISQADYNWKRMFHDYLYNYTTEFPGQVIEYSYLLKLYEDQLAGTVRLSRVYGGPWSLQII